MENRRSKAGGLGWEVPQFYRWGRNSNCVNFNISLFFMWHRKLEYWEIMTGTETLKISKNIDYGFGVGNFLIPSSIAEKGSSPHMLSRSFWSCTQEVSLLCFQSVHKWPSTYPLELLPPIQPEQIYLFYTVTFCFRLYLKGSMYAPHSCFENHLGFRSHNSILSNSANPVPHLLYDSV